MEVEWLSQPLFKKDGGMQDPCRDERIAMSIYTVQISESLSHDCNCRRDDVLMQTELFFT
jgi:hypothetical protein